MYCEKCGKKLEEDAKFCVNCGNKLDTVSQPMEKFKDDEVRLSVKPKFRLMYKLLSCIAGSAFLFVWLIGAIILEAVIESEFLGSTLTSIVLGSVAVLVLIYAIILLIIKKQYDSYDYDFYNTKVVYTDSFINLSEKEVKYKYIREITMRQSFVQRWFKIGNIILFTNAETGTSNGICIRDVENVQEVYKNIKDIINV